MPVRRCRGDSLGPPAATQIRKRTDRPLRHSRATAASPGEFRSGGGTAPPAASPVLPTKPRTVPPRYAHAVGRDRRERSRGARSRSSCLRGRGAKVAGRRPCSRPTENSAAVALRRRAGAPGMTRRCRRRGASRPSARAKPHVSVNDACAATGKTYGPPESAGVPVYGCALAGCTRAGVGGGGSAVVVLAGNVVVDAGVVDGGGGVRIDSVDAVVVGATETVSVGAVLRRRLGDGNRLRHDRRGRGRGRRRGRGVHAGFGGRDRVDDAVVARRRLACGYRRSKPSARADDRHRRQSSGCASQRAPDPARKHEAGTETKFRARSRRFAARIEAMTGQRSDPTRMETPAAGSRPVGL